MFNNFTMLHNILVMSRFFHIRKANKFSPAKKIAIIDVMLMKVSFAIKNDSVGLNSTERFHADVNQCHCTFLLSLITNKSLSYTRWCPEQWATSQHTVTAVVCTRDFAAFHIQWQNFKSSLWHLSLSNSLVTGKQWIETFLLPAQVDRRIGVLQKIKVIHEIQ